MRRGRPNHLENLVIGLAVLLALVLAYFGAQKAFSSRAAARGGAVPSADAARPEVAGKITGSGTESAVTGLPSFKLSSVRRPTKRPVPPPPSRSR